MASWRSMFAPQILGRAREYYCLGKAKRLVREEDRWDVLKITYTATVRGSRNYSVEIDEYEGVVEGMSCTCPYAQSGGNCKHEAAVLYAIEDEYYKLEAADAEDADDGEKKGSRTGAGSAGNVMADRPAADPGTAAGRKSEEDKIIYPASLPALDALQKEEAQHRRELAETEPGTEGYQPGDYRYFHPENFEKGLKITAEAEKKAKAILAAEKKPQPSERSLSYYMHEDGPLENFQVRIGFPGGDGSEPMRGEAAATTGDSYFRSQVRIVFDQNHVISASCNNWNCNHWRDNSEIGHILCGHEVALIRKTEAYLSANNVGDATSLGGIHFLDEMLLLAAEQKDAEKGTGENPEADQAAGGTRILTLEPHVELLDGNLSASFYVGSSKLYKIKDLNAFVSAVQNQDEMEFGKSTVLPMGRQYLKEGRSTAWYAFIRDALQEKSQRDEYYRSVDRNYLPGDTIKADLPLFGHRLDEFARLAEGAPFEYWDKAYAAKQGKKRLSVRDVMSAIHLEVHAAVSGRTSAGGRNGKAAGKAKAAGNRASAGTGDVFEGVRISGDAPEFIRGQDRLYYAEGSWFNRIGPEDSRRIAPLVNVAQGGKIDIRVGRSHLADFYHKVLPQLRQMAEVTEYDADLIARYIPPEPSFTAYFDTENQSILCRLETSYGPQVFASTDVIEAFQKEKPLVPAYRDEESEADYVETALRYIPAYDQRLHILFCQKNDEQVFDLLDHGLAELGSMGEVRMTQRFRSLGIRRHVKFSMGVSIESNLMDLTMSSDDLTEDEMYEILYQYQRKRRFVRLKDGTFFKLENNGTLENLVQIMETMQVSLKDFVKGKMHLPAYRALYLDRMLEGTEDLYASRDRRFKELIKEFKTVEDADFEVPARLQKVLRNYQKDGYRWLRTLDRYGFGGILADEMGLGKTVQVIAVILAAKQEEGAIPGQVSAAQSSAGDSPAAGGQSGVSFVICPASLVYNWEEEFHRFAPELSVSVIAGTAAERHELLASVRSGGNRPDVLVTSYDLLKRDIAEYEELSFRYEIIDEGQFIKNARTAAAKSVKLIHAKTRFALTGTPIENRLSELWSIFDYLMPGFLYDYAQFQTAFEIPIGRESEAAAERLRKMIAPFILRRRKEDVLKDLPEKLEEVRYVALEGRQLQLYDAQVMKMKADLKDQSDVDFRKGKIEILAELMRIRQLCCDPELVYANYDGSSAKREALLDMIRTLLDEGHRALIFSQFTSMLELVSQDLDREKIPYYTITGATPKAKRMELVRAFNAGGEDSPDRIPDHSGNGVPAERAADGSGVNIFLISLKAGGTGLNLTGADVVIHYDPWWNTAAEDQATDRAHRIGQKKVVTVYRLIARGTIEDRIMEMQSRKKDLADQVLGGEGIGSSRLTKEDLMEILE